MNEKLNPPPYFLHSIGELWTILTGDIGLFVTMVMYVCPYFPSHLAKIYSFSYDYNYFLSSPQVSRIHESGALSTLYCAIDAAILFTRLKPSIALVNSNRLQYEKYIFLTILISEELQAYHSSCS
jgi:hypothetical protein